MTFNSLTEAQHASLVRNQELFSNHMNERIRKLGIDGCHGTNRPVLRPALLPIFAIDTSLLELAREKNDGDFKNLTQVLHEHMGYYNWCQPLIDGVDKHWDVRPRIAKEIVFLIWYQEMYSLGYRLLTEKAADKLHDKEASIFLRSWLEREFSADYTSSRRIRHAVRLVSPQPQIVDSHKYTSYCLKAAYSRKEYEFSILAASYHDTTMQGLWLYKPSSRNKDRVDSGCEADSEDREDK